MIEWVGLFVVMGATLAYAVHQRAVAVRTSNQSYEMLASRDESDSDEEKTGPGSIQQFDRDAQMHVTN